MAVRCHKVTIVQSLFERSTQVPDNRYLQEAPHSDNAPKFKGTVVLDGGSLLYTINRRKEKHVRDLSWPVNEVCEELPALGVCNQDSL